jgi:shikimate dehydrogenase
MIELGLIGFPIKHSFSPIIHQAALRYCNLAGSYSLFPILPSDQSGLKELLARVRDREITGLNVTIPYKEIVIPLLDELTPTAITIGAVNTIYSQNGKLVGANTDAAGFIKDLVDFTTREMLIFKKNKSVLVLGGGGSARAIVYALLDDDWKVILATRQSDQADKLIDQLSNHRYQIANIEFQDKAIQSINPPPDLIINTTPLGMSPDIENSPWPGNLPFPPEAAVYDLVYNPPVTKLVHQAKEAGLPAITGLGMLVEQAAKAFELWTGRLVPREVLFAVMEEK